MRGTGRGGAGLLQCHGGPCGIAGRQPAASRLLSAATRTGALTGTPTVRCNAGEHGRTLRPEAGASALPSLAGSFLAAAAGLLPLLLGSAGLLALAAAASFLAEAALGSASPLLRARLAGLGASSSSSSSCGAWCRAAQDGSGRLREGGHCAGAGSSVPAGPGCSEMDRGGAAVVATGERGPRLRCCGGRTSSSSSSSSSSSCKECVGRRVRLTRNAEGTHGCAKVPAGCARRPLHSPPRPRRRRPSWTSCPARTRHTQHSQADKPTACASYARPGPGLRSACRSHNTCPQHHGPHSPSRPLAWTVRAWRTWSSSPPPSSWRPAAPPHRPGTCSSRLHGPPPPSPTALMRSSRPPWPMPTTPAAARRSHATAALPRPRGPFRTAPRASPGSSAGERSWTPGDTEPHSTAQANK